MELNKAMQGFHNVKKFNDKKPDWRDIIEAIDAARYAPMAGDNYTLKFILVDDKETIQKLADAAQQPFISQVHYVVVVCSNPLRTINLYEERGKTYLKQQAGAGIQNLLLKLDEIGISSYWVRHFVDYLIKKELNIPDNIEVEALLPIGYEFEKQRIKKAPIDIDRILYFGKYGNKKMKMPKKLED